MSKRKIQIIEDKFEVEEVIKLIEDEDLRNAYLNASNKVKAILNGIYKGLSPAEAAIKAGAHAGTVANWKYRNPVHKKLYDTFVMSQIVVAEGELYKLVKSGDLWAIKYFLENKAPKEWQSTQNVNQKVRMDADITQTKRILDD